jgi:hypothetical protein
MYRLINPSLSAKEDDIDDKVDPTVTYLQKLGPEYLDLISESAKWVLSLDKKKGLQVRRSIPSPLLSIQLTYADFHH